MEVKRLDEGIKLLREELREFRDEVRTSLQMRTTTSDLDNVIRYIDREMHHTMLRINMLEEKTKEDGKHKRQMVISLITVAVGTLLSAAMSFMG